MSGAEITVDVVHAVPAEQVTRRVVLPDDATVADALAASGLAGQVTPAGVGIWGRPVEPGAALRDGDRVEVYRPLTADPKEARRARARRAARDEQSR